MNNDFPIQTSELNDLPAECRRIIRFVKTDDLPAECRRLAEIVGLEKCLIIISQLGCGYLYLPPISRLLTAARNRSIRAEFNGRNYKELAIRHGLTVRWIRNIVADQSIKKQPANQPNHDPSNPQRFYKQQKLF